MSLIKRRKFSFFPRHKALPDQAGFWRRYLAFTVDTVLIFLISFVLFLAYYETRALSRGEEGLVSRFVKSLKEDKPFILASSEKELERAVEYYFRQQLKIRLSAAEYEKAELMSFEKLKRDYAELIDFADVEDNFVLLGETYNIFREIAVGYVYFILFFRFGGRTPGKRIFRLKVVDLRGRKLLRFYQAFERTHGYAASALIAFIGFLQVLWDKEGLTMHDKLAGTTVVKLPSRPKYAVQKARLKKKKEPARLNKKTA